MFLKKYSQQKILKSNAWSLNMLKISFEDAIFSVSFLPGLPQNMKCSFFGLTDFLAISRSRRVRVGKCFFSFSSSQLQIPRKLLNTAVLNVCSISVILSSYYLIFSPISFISSGFISIPLYVKRSTISLIAFSVQSKF